MVEENTDGQTVYNVYDAMGNRTDFSLFRGTTEISSISYGYNSNGWMTSMSGNGTSATYAYDGNGNRTSTTYGNGNVVSYTYNAANYPTLVANRSGSNTISSFVYTYALDGNVATKTDHTGKVTEYTYDGMNRLTEEVQKKNGVLVQSYAYTFDDFNNRSTLTAAGADAYTVAYSYDKNNRLLEDIKTSTDETAKTLYFYDPNGNQIGRSMETLTSSQDAESISATTAVASYEKSWYNGFNQMVGTKVDGVEATYSYAPSGLRLSKTIDGTTIDYALDGDFVAAELNGDTVTARYNRGLELVGSTIGDTTSYYLYNAHGDVVNLTNTSGAATKSYEYDAFGNEVNPAANDTNPFRYCGEYFDAETGRIYLRARYYDPVIGRMLAEDPYGCNIFLADNDELSSPSNIIQYADLYIYAAQNPIMFADYTGLWTLAIGVSGMIEFLGRAESSTMFVVDQDWHIGIVRASGLGAGTVGGGYSGALAWTNAPSIYDLKGIGMSAGLSGILGAGIDYTGAGSVSGATLSLGGVSTPWVEIHTSLSYSDVTDLSWLIPPSTVESFVRMIRDSLPRNIQTELDSRIGWNLV